MSAAHDDRSGNGWLGALACHITSGLTCVVTGVLATTAAKRPGRHTSAGTLGYLARRRRWRGWLRIHLLGMSGSYIALLTGFYVDNGPRLPLWNRLPDIAFWLLPSLVGIPLVVRAMARRHLTLLRQPAGGRLRSGPPPGRPG